MRNTGRLTRWLLGVSMVALSAPQALAQSGGDTTVETIVVTAQKRAENIQDVPMSVSALGGEYLEERGLTSVMDIARFLPSLSIIQSNNNRNSSVVIRGIGTSGTNPGIEPSVGVFVDGVYLPAAGPIQVNLQDVASIEVLRGPQGTLYGRNTPVGAVNITTRAPQQKREAMLTVGIGDYEERRVGGYVGGGLTDTLAGRLSFWLSDREGYETNLFDGDPINGSQQAGVRGRLKWEPAPDLDVNLIAYYTTIIAGCCTVEQIDPTGPGGIATPGFLAASAAAGRPFRNFDGRDHVVDEDFRGRNDTAVYGGSLQVDKDFADGHLLTSISAYSAYDDYIKQLAADGLPLDVVRGYQRLVSEVFSEELRLLSPSDQRLEYIVGLYLFAQNMRYDTQTQVGTQATRVFPGNARLRPGDFNHFYYRQRTESVAAFGQATFNVTDALRLTGGLRWAFDDKRAYIASDNSPGSTPQFRSIFPINILGNVARDETKVTWSAGAQYDLTPDIMGYTLVATGYKTGGFNARSAQPNTPFEFDAENSITYEAGLKATLLDQTLILNVNVYRMELENFQDSQLNPLTGVGFIVGNAGDRRVDGVEADFRWRPLAALSVNGNLAYMDGEFTDYPAGECYAGRTPDGTRPGTCNYNGLTPSQNPKWRWGLAGQWTQPIGSGGLEAFVNGDISYTGSQLLTSTLDPRSFQDSYTLLSARIGLQAEDGAWRLALYGRNLTDEAYYVVNTAQPLAALVSGGGTAGAMGFGGWYGPPRTWGVELQAKF